MVALTRDRMRKRHERRKMKGVKRKKLGKYLKLQVLSDQDFKCNICKEKLVSTADEINLFDYDHIQTHAQTGDDSLENIQAICLICHRKKSVREFREFYKSREGLITLNASPIKKPIDSQSRVENRFSKYSFQK